ncbi:RWD domain-containing protein [Stachybotrys elegans]|uniref:RBR-type E3 ubiquitin transferase n=1 Tax=Stachybotrys elegans TaxID=80388 RepID=A0A8K0ST03_9HYPO|nr:RWD domain-containing protein [Stachybotrys elegans]
MDTETPDARAEELDTLLAIYPEIRQLEGFAFELELPVAPAQPISVTFPAPAAVPPPAPLAVPSATSSRAAEPPLRVSGAAPELDTSEISHLPPLTVHMTLPEGYPPEKPPVVRLSTTPPWLSDSTIHRLESDASNLWEESARDMMCFTYIDHLQRAAEDVFDTISAGGVLRLHPEHRLAVLDYDIKAKKAAFEKETFECGVCLDPKKGIKCHKMLECGHVFCLQCLFDFYHDAITAGTIDTVRCLAPNCAKERTEKHTENKLNRRKPKIFISPSELLQIGLAEDTVKRYVDLKYKIELEADKNTIYCPRQWCNGAARSKKHKKPEGLVFNDLSDNEDQDAGPESEKAVEKKPEKFDPAELLCVCEDCGLAFCSRCYQSWHGEFFRCYPRRDRDELTAEEKLSLEYIQLYTSPCPTCSAPAQKTFGCNHMRCSRCDTHFCYLCSSWLDPRNPYQHYNEQPGGKVTGCYMRLWELEGENEDFGPQRVPRIQQEEHRGLAVHPVPEIEEPDDSDSEHEMEERQHQPLHDNGHNIAVAREAPLVLRLVDDQAGQPPIPPPAPEAPPIQGGRGRNAPRRGGRGGNRGGPAVRGNGGPPAAAGGGARGARADRIPDQRQLPGQHNQVDNRNNPQPAGELGPAQQAWVRNFVQLALIDAEDEMEWNSDEEDGDDWRFG